MTDETQEQQITAAGNEMSASFLAGKEAFQMKSSPQ